ncbi:hypothetical protein D8674_015392 [Pyrus ussuriensis x Pyrus communis]|uniref:Uncharacterized protein n=1 Tax=Pyrus ussuriensis x Pyrus communis TaxID=2448454 RepID=A0A5N5GY87_9ROSA|nr:hypothetical protein D8674_015392 [Pyrus ussuriensis x Pyrus communis]
MLSNNQHWILITTAAVEADTLLEAAEEVEDTPAPDSLVLEDNHRLHFAKSQGQAYIMMMASRTPGTPRAKKEKIVVLVCLRPLSKREELAKEQVSWDCLGDNTIVYKPPPHERSTQSASFTFDKVFGPGSTEAVYEEGVRNVALSSLMGINATIFAYGQSGSGKTYTMKGIMEKAVDDIYNHITNTPEREFGIKISGLEIYNENVRDLLNTESVGNLKLLDDPEKGIVVEKLVEEAASSHQHLRSLIGICEAQREVGETALNDNSSRSHQIIRLTIESTVRESLDCRTSFVASLNFVDLAGSERAPETHADGVRLREGCHINLSLMTLTNVIRKLSAGKLSGHIPYRDSKLTRILQHSLGGNARTAIICTLSPALSHAEQSRNTLFFATQAKEVTNDASVNTVVSDKQLVKHLQKQVAKLEAELYTLYPLRERIQQMEMEMEDLRSERDLAHSQADELRHKLEVQSLYPLELPHRSVDNYLSYTGVLPISFYAKELGDCDTATNARTKHSIRHSSTPPFMPRREVLKHEISSEQLSEEPSRALKLKVLYKSKLVIPPCIQDLAFRCLEDLFRPQINSLLLSTQAKGESNMVVPDKKLVKRLQMEVLRRETEVPTVSREEDLRIQKVLNQLELPHPYVKKLIFCIGALPARNTMIRHSMRLSSFAPFTLNHEILRLEVLLVQLGEGPCRALEIVLQKEVAMHGLENHDRARNTMIRHPIRLSSFAPFMLNREILKLEVLLAQLGEGPSRALEIVLQKEVAWQGLENQDAGETFCNLQAEIKETHYTSSRPKEFEVGSLVPVNKNEIPRLHSQGSAIANLEEQFPNVQYVTDKLVSLPCIQLLALRFLEDLFRPREVTGDVLEQIKNEPLIHNIVPLLGSWQEDEAEDDGGFHLEPGTSIAAPPDVSAVEYDYIGEHVFHVKVEHPADRYEKKTISDEAKELMDCHRETSDSSAFRNGKIDVSVENCDFLGFLCSNGGQLLICNTSNCPSVFHQNFESDLICYKKGKYYCPICSYSLAHENRLGEIEEKLRRKAVAFEEVFSGCSDGYIVDEQVNARNESGYGCDSQFDDAQVHNQFVRVEDNEIKEGTEFEVEDENNGGNSVSCRGEGTNEIIRGGSGHQCVSELLELQQDEETAVEESSDKNEEDEDGKRVFAEKEDEIENAEFMQPESMEVPSNTIFLSDTESPVVHKRREDNEIKEGMKFEVEDENNDGDSVNCRGEGTNKVIRGDSEHPCVSELLELQQDEETAVEENSDTDEEDDGKRVFAEKENEIENAELMRPESLEMPSNTIVLSDTESPVVHKNHEKAPKSFTIVLSDSSESDASDTSSPSMEPEVSDTWSPLLGEIQPKHKAQKTSESGNQPTRSNLPLPRRRRRLRLYWTREEEEKLKELVNSFPTTGKNRCWKKILENGRDVFHKDRTPNDLRNKWGKMRVKGNAEF